MKRRFFLLLLPFILASALLLWLFGSQETEAEPVPAQTSVTNTLPVDAAAINLNDNLFHPARLTGQTQNVLAPPLPFVLASPPRPHLDPQSVPIHSLPELHRVGLPVAYAPVLHSRAAFSPVVRSEEHTS